MEKKNTEKGEKQKEKIQIPIWEKSNLTIKDTPVGSTTTDVGATEGGKLVNELLQAIEEGLIKTFIEAGAVVSTPTCGPCLGGYMGILAKGERCISTTNRNFVGRMGHVESEVYLASPAVAAASAITGKISSPEEVM